MTPGEMHMEDDDAARRSRQRDREENDQGASKRAPNSQQGTPVPDQGAGPGTDNPAAPAEGTGGGVSDGGGSTGEGGGASQGGGTGN